MHIMAVNKISVYLPLVSTSVVAVIHTLWTPLDSPLAFPAGRDISNSPGHSRHADHIGKADQLAKTRQNCGACHYY